jgi:Aromatic acid exporter family member 1
VKVSKEPAPLTAPLTALLVVQVTLYATLTTGVRRVAAVVIGVLIAITFSAVVGLSWWSLGLIILAALVVGRLIRVDESVNEVAISAMLVLGVTRLASQAWARVFETLIGAGVGLAFNFVFAPPVWVDPAAESIEDLAGQVRRLLRRIADEFGDPPQVERAEAKLHEARRLDQHVAEVDEALRQAEDSLRLNPRISEGLLSRLVLRTGLDTLEVCVVIVRGLARSLTDLAKRGERDAPLFPAPIAASLTDLFGHVGAAVASYAVLVTSQVSSNAEEAESRLAAELSAAWASRARAADLLLNRVQQQPHAWQLHGSMLADIERILDELDLEHRSRRLMEELDRSSLQRKQRYARLGRLGRFARGEG